MKIFICRCAAWFATVPAILGLWAFCGLWYTAGLHMEPLITVLSILALTSCQLVLMAQDVDTKAIQVKLDELIHAIDAADDDKAGIEKHLDRL